MNKAQKDGVIQNVKGRAKPALAIVPGVPPKESEGAADSPTSSVKKPAGELNHAVAKKLET